MVSSKLEDHLKSMAIELSNQSISLYKYKGDDAEIAFDIVTSDTFIAGIADKLIERISLSTEETSLLEKKLLVNGEWFCNDGHTHSLNHLPELKKYAGKIEELRIICRKILMN